MNFSKKEMIVWENRNSVMPMPREITIVKRE
jgi:hypothetical protein